MAVVCMDCAATSSQAILELIAPVEGWQFVLKIMLISKKENKSCFQIRLGIMILIFVIMQAMHELLTLLIWCHVVVFCHLTFTSSNESVTTLIVFLINIRPTLAKSIPCVNKSTPSYLGNRLNCFLILGPSEWKWNWAIHKIIKRYSCRICWSKFYVH